MADRIIWNEAGLAAVLRGHGGPVAKDLARRAYKVRSGAIRRCPVGTPESTHKPGYVGGRLRAGIYVEMGADAEGLFADIGDNVEYALYVHEGTWKMAGRPFLTDALHDAML